MSFFFFPTTTTTSTIIIILNFWNTVYNVELGPETKIIASQKLNVMEVAGLDVLK